MVLKLALWRITGSVGNGKLVEVGGVEGGHLLTGMGVYKVQMQVDHDAHFVSGVLRGNDTTEMRVSLVRFIDDELPQSDD